MNKSNKILLSVLSFVVVCVIGYALFSDNITVTGTATAKGSFDIAVTCTPGATTTLKTAMDAQGNELTGGKAYTKVESGYTNDTCSVIDSGATFSANLSMPSAARYFTIKLKNNGTINAKLNIATGYKTTATVCLDENGDNIAEDCLEDRPADFLGFFPVAFNRADGTEVLITDSNSQAEFGDPTDSSSIILSPNESLVVLGVVQWPADESDDWLNNKLFITRGTATFDFVQATN